MATTKEERDDIEKTKKWECGDPYQYPIEGEGDHWEKILAPLLERDRAQCDSWKDEVQNLLIFAGLFSAVLTAFAVVSYPSLQTDQNEVMINLLARIASQLESPNNNTFPAIVQPINIASFASPPSASSIRVNIYWFISLVLSLATALIGIVSLQWLREHQQYPSSLSFKEKFGLFHMRAEGLEAWYVPQIFSAMPLLLQSALILFFVGLIDFLLASSLKVAIPVIIAIGIPFTFLFLATTIPSLQMFVFCLPLTDGTRSRVPQQAPFKSPQSRTLQRLLTISWRAFSFYSLSINAIYSLLILYPRRFLQLLKRDHSSLAPKNGDLQVHAMEPAKYDIFKILKSKSWLSFDMSWLVMRDTYSRCITDQTPWSIQGSSRAGPVYDMTTGLFGVTSEYADQSLHRLKYLAIRDVTASIIGDQASPFLTLNQRRDYNQYFQRLMISQLFGVSKKPVTFSSYLKDPSVAFLQDENTFIFSSIQYLSPPPDILQHFAELHIRILNYLYSRASHPTTDDPLLETPVYCDNLFLWTYGKSQHKVQRYGPYLDGAISEQFSLALQTFFNVSTDPKIDEKALFTSFYGQPFPRILRFAAIQQKADSVQSTLNFLSASLKSYVVGKLLSKRSDLVFWASAFYARSLLLSDPLSFVLEEDQPTYDNNPIVEAFLPTLRQYLQMRGSPDDALQERLGIPDISDSWWDFLHLSDTVEETKLLSSEGPIASSTSATEIMDLSLSLAKSPRSINEKFPMLPYKSLGDMLTTNPDAEDLV